MRYALVTGGSRGIGRAICVQLAEMGHYILINYTSKTDEAEKTLAMVREKGSNGEILKFDVSNQPEVETVLVGWTDKNPDKTIEILVNNAGLQTVWPYVLKLLLFFCCTLGITLYFNKSKTQ